MCLHAWVSDTTKRISFTSNEAFADLIFPISHLRIHKRSSAWPEITLITILLSLPAPKYTQVLHLHQKCININVLTYTLYAFASGHTQCFLLTYTPMHEHFLPCWEINNKAHTHTPTVYTHPVSLQLRMPVLPEGFELIDILPNCPGLLQGTSLCSAADKAHSITAADLK